MAMSLADKLALLRLQNGMSKADLAEKLGISESEVAAWEADTATPDLAMLPKLASLYHVTVDAILSAESVPQPGQTPPSYQAPDMRRSAQTPYQQPGNYQPEYHQQGNPQQGYQQPHNQQANNQQQAAGGKKGFSFGTLFDFAETVVNSSKRRKTAKMLFVFPFPLLVVFAYIFAGAVLHLWDTAWIMFLLIPCYYMIAASLMVKTKKAFLLIQPVPIVIVILFLMLGFGLNLWHPAWILFLIIPAYYWFVAVFVKGRRR